MATSRFPGLSSVAITNPTDGQVLVYDAASGTWVNGEAAGGTVSTSAPISGNGDPGDPITLDPTVDLTVGSLSAGTGPFATQGQLRIGAADWSWWAKDADANDLPIATYSTQVVPQGLLQFGIENTFALFDHTIGGESIGLYAGTGQPDLGIKISFNDPLSNNGAGLRFLVNYVGGGDPDLVMGLDQNDGYPSFWDESGVGLLGQEGKPWDAIWVNYIENAAGLNIILGGALALQPTGDLTINNIPGVATDGFTKGIYTGGGTVNWATNVVTMNEVVVQKDISSITSVTTTATATTATPHHFTTGDTVTIAGATGDSDPYNGEYTITVTGADTFTYTFAGSTESPAAGTITVTKVIA